MVSLPQNKIQCPKTEGIKYTGSKLKLLPYILQLTAQVQPKTVLDGFSGTTRVSQSLAQTGYQVFANDISVWSKVFGVCYLKNKQNRAYYQDLIDQLNALQGKDGWFTENYGGLPNQDLGDTSFTNGLKKPWQIHNTQKLDAIREEIDRLKLSENEKAVALTSLILALDQVDNTLGHYAAYLNKWSPRSYKKIKLVVPHLFVAEQEHEVYSEDILDLTKHLPKVDLAYFDPPYGSNNDKMPASRVRYAAYYHLWTTICLNDQAKLFGKAKRRTDTSDTLAASVFEEFRKDAQGGFLAVKAIKKLLEQTSAHYIMLSYSSGGRATAEELNKILAQTGKILQIEKIDYSQNVMSTMRWTNDWIRDEEKQHSEYLFLIEKNT